MLVACFRGAGWGHEVRNDVFLRRFVASKIASIVGPDRPFFLSGFNQSGVPGLVFPNEADPGTSDLTMTALSTVSGDGWFVHPSLGSYGLGIGNNGALNESGLIANSPCINLSGRKKVTYIIIFKAFSDGQGDAGRICEAAASQIMFTHGQVGQAYQLSLSLMNGGWASLTTTNLEGRIDQWHAVKISVDENQAFGSRGAINFDGRNVAVTDALGDHIEDPGNGLTLLNEQGGILRDFDGVIGLFCVIPRYTMSDVEFNPLVELRGLFQTLAADQPDIVAPGVWGTPDYRFVRANDDHLYTQQAYPLKTQAGSLMVAFVPLDMTNQQTLFGLSTEGDANGDVLGLQLRGDVANDPLEWNGRTAGAANLQLQFPSAGIRVPHIVWVTSDGSEIRAYVNGREQVVTAVLGANAGQWWADYAGTTVAVAGAIREAVVAEEADVLMPVIMAYDRQVACLEIQRQWAAGWGVSGPRIVFPR